jgi:putative transposase
MREYCRRLPHIDIPGAPVFLTWRLSGSLPPERIFPRETLESGEAFLFFDRLLDNALEGPMYLRQAQIATIVVEQIQQVCAQRLHAWVVMPNHVHLLCTTESPLSELVRKLKGPTAFRANKLLGLSGKPFWQQEYFDRGVRNDKEFEKIRHYIEWNPVKAALVARPEDYQWSSAWKPEVGGGLQPALGFSQASPERLKVPERG